MKREEREELLFILNQLDLVFSTKIPYFSQFPLSPLCFTVKKSVYPPE